MPTRAIRNITITTDKLAFFLKSRGSLLILIIKNPIKTARATRIRKAMTTLLKLRQHI